jgi:hypothetical protein
MDLIGFVCVSLGSNTARLHDSLGYRPECACSEAGFSSQDGDRVKSVLPKSDVVLCVFCGKGLNVKDMFAVESVCRVKRFTAGSRNFLKDVDDARPGRPAEVATEATVQRVVELI